MDARRQRHAARLLLAVLVLGVLASLIVQISAIIDGPSASTPTIPNPTEVIGAGTSATTGVEDTTGPVGPFSDLPPIDVSDLPPEAIDTLDLIDDGGPFLFDQDGGVFQNREAILPDEPDGHYREYTVVTPGSDDRGARRIVTGADGERYYSDDHYDSFSEIVDESP